LRSFKISEDSKLTLEEKLKLIESYDLDDLIHILREIESSQKSFCKEVIIAVHNKIFEHGITCI
jgi:ATP-dependent RNA circularization protein (DNA/RNA ligase family)